MDFDKYYPKQDAQKTATGVWAPMSATFEVLVAPANNPQFQELTKRLMRPHRIAIQRNALPEDELNKIGAQVMARTILLGWRGKAVMGGKPVPAYSTEAAEKLLLEFQGFREDVAVMSADRNLFAAEGLKAELGNSPTTSAGNSSGGDS